MNESLEKMEMAETTSEAELDSVGRAEEEFGWPEESAALGWNLKEVIRAGRSGECFDGVKIKKAQDGARWCAMEQDERLMEHEKSDSIRLSKRIRTGRTPPLGKNRRGFFRGHF